MTTRYYRGLEVLYALDEPKTVEKLSTALELDIEECADRVTYLEVFDRVSKVGETVYLAK